MGTQDFIICLVVAAAASVAVYFQVYFLAVFLILFFILMLLNIYVFYEYHIPKPVFIAEISYEPESQEQEDSHQE